MASDPSAGSRSREGAGNCLRRGLGRSGVQAAEGGASASSDVAALRFAGARRRGARGFGADASAAGASASGPAAATASIGALSVSGGASGASGSRSTLNSRIRKAGTWSPMPGRAGPLAAVAPRCGRRRARRARSGVRARAPAARPAARFPRAAPGPPRRRRRRGPRLGAPAAATGRALRGVPPRARTGFSAGTSAGAFSSGLSITGIGFFTSSSILARYFSSCGRQRVIDLPERPGAAGAADAVDVILGVDRHVEVEDVADVRDVEAARGDVRGDQQLQLAVAEAA